MREPPGTILTCVRLFPVRRLTDAGQGPPRVRQTDEREVSVGGLFYSAVQCGGCVPHLPFGESYCSCSFGLGGALGQYLPVAALPMKIVLY